MSGSMPAPQLPQRAPVPLPQMPQGPQMPQMGMSGGGMPQQQMPQQGGAPQQPQIVPPVVGGMAAQNPNLAMFAKAAQGMPGGPQQQLRPGQQRLTPAEMGRLGRFGDQLVAHLTPGEIQVPPELQTPKVLATLTQAFRSAGVTPQQFMAGSPASSTNPQTGAPEYSLWAALLPVLGAVAGSVIPGVGTAAGMALGGAAGGLAGSVVDHTGLQGALLGTLGGAAGGYLGGAGGLGSLLSSGAAGAAGAGAAGAAGAGAADAAAGAMAADVPSAGAGAATMAGAGPLGSAGAAASPTMTLAQRLMGGLYAGTGASLASSLAPPQTNNSGLPPGFGDHMAPLNPNYGQIIGSNQSATPSFAGYNPYTTVMGPNPGYRFFPVS